MQKFIAKGGVLTPNVTVASPTGTAIQIQNAAGQEVVNFVAETDKTLSIHSGAVSAKPALTITSGGIISNVAQATNVAALTRKDYVDAQIKVVSDKVADTTSTDARYLRLSGGTLTGSINISHATPQIIFTESDQTPEKKYIFVSDGGGIRLNEDTTAGRNIWLYSPTKDSIELYKPSAPSAGTTAASLTRKDYVDAEVTKAIASAKTAGDKDYVRVIGDAMTGALVVSVDSTLPIIAENGTNQAAFGCSITAGEYIFGGKAKSSSDYQHYIRLGNNKFQYYQAGTTYDVYHTGKKPGAADVGALALSGGTLTGDLVTKNIQLAATADVGLKNSSGTNVIRQSSTGHNVVVGNNTGELYLDFATKLYARQGTSTFEVYTTGNKPDAAAVGAVPTSRKVNDKALTADITLTAGDVGAVPPERTVNVKPLSANVVLAAADVNAVPTTRTINTKPLSADITLTAADVSAVPMDRKVNGKP